MQKVVLCILDGCGLNKKYEFNAFSNAKKDTLDMLLKKYPHSKLDASGISVGLKEGIMGTSEVGHLNLGAGRIIKQPLSVIDDSITDKSFYKNKEILKVLDHVKKNKSNLHIFGLLSDGGVHSHINHLFELLEMCKKNNVSNIYLDICLDGRDTYYKSALKYLKLLEDKLNELKIGKISTISGRYYGMDRDNNFDRVKLSYDAICYGKGKKYNTYKELIDESYKNNITDEFILPSLKDNKPLSDNDALITFNFRKDRLRELFTLLTNPYYYKDTEIEVKYLKNLKVLTMYPVVSSVKCPSAFKEQSLKNILGEYLYKNNISQLRLAETEKFAHVTFFFDGGKEVEYKNMKKILIPSPKVPTYDLKPEMSAYEVTEAFLKEFKNYDVVIMNLANGDMVGHTGNYIKAKEAVEHMDKCIKKIYEEVIRNNGILIIVADHGNCEVMEKDGNIVTSHTTNKVPCIITKEGIKLKDGNLSNIAPTILDLLGLKKPKEMESNSLIIK